MAKGRSGFIFSSSECLRVLQHLTDDELGFLEFTIGSGAQIVNEDIEMMKWSQSLYKWEVVEIDKHSVSGINIIIATKLGIRCLCAAYAVGRLKIST